MEQIPGDESILNKTQEQELSFDQKLILAQTLNRAVDNRNTFIQRQGGFDNFAEVGQHTDNLRSVYDDLERAVTNARKEFDENVHNKKEFVQQLKNIGENNNLAIRISSIFAVPKESILSRIFKNKDS
ncbi:MAG: hypothetical protein AAB795_00415 [Patescibacteria group bacterium]